MTSDISPISVTTLVSLALHASLLLAVVQTNDIIQATGNGIRIELVSSTHVSDQSETEQAAGKAAASVQQAGITGLSEAVETAATNNARAADSVPEAVVPTSERSSRTASLDNDHARKVVTRSTSASSDNGSIVELLHARISENKQYPYLARRQRREGTARIEFVLHPDGRIDNAHLVDSSRTRTLDDAALKAVKGIEPFRPAIDYLEQPEAFQVDVVFNVM